MRHIVIAAAVVMLAALPARAVQLDIGDGAGTVGDTVSVVVTTSDLTGLGVYSYEMRVTWSVTRAILLDAPQAGTVTDPWGPAIVNAQPGEVNLNAAGVTPLSGAGTLINLRFVLGPSSGGTTLTFADFTFNEGVPVDTLSNGILSVTALPTITISPNSGEIVVGDSLAFATGGSGTPPYTYSSSDAGVADFAGTNYLKGVAPGSVVCTSTDDNGITDDTSGVVWVRAFTLMAGSGAGMPGDTISVPITLTDPTAYNIKSAEFAVTFSEARLTAIGVDDTGSIAQAAGWQASVFNISSGRIDVSMAGVSDLASAGVLVNIRFVIDPGGNTTVTLTPTAGMFNEVYPPFHQSGSVTITGFPVITAYPNTATIVVGDNLACYVTGTTTPPLTWGVTNPGVASIDGAGNLTALSAGTTRVFVVDNVGATDTTSTILVCDLYVSAPVQDIYANVPTPVEISPDRSVSGMGIYGYELTLTWNPAQMEAVSVDHAGTLSAAWGPPVVNNLVPGKIIIVHAGPMPLTGLDPLIIVNFIRPTGSLGGVTTLTFTKMIFNEGDPCALTQNGTISVPTGIADTPRYGSELFQNIPNPFNPVTTIRYQLDAPSLVTVRVYSADGVLVRTLVNRFHANAGDFEVRWDGRNGNGELAASGVYLYRLETPTTRVSKKMVLIK
jgi:hypothetical protein